MEQIKDHNQHTAHFQHKDQNQDSILQQFYKIDAISVCEWVRMHKVTTRAAERKVMTLGSIVEGYDIEQRRVRSRNWTAQRKEGNNGIAVLGQQ